MKRVLAVAILSGLVTTGWARAEGQDSPTFVVWDTGKPSATPLSPEMLAKAQGWTRIPRNATARAFKGDAVLSNGRLTAVVRRNDSRVELYSVTARGIVSRTRLRLVGPGGQAAAKLVQLGLVDRTRSQARVEASYRTASGKTGTARFRVKRGDAAVQIEPGAGTESLQVECPGRFVVLPDFFADDIVIDARKIPVEKAELPSENFIMHMTGAGEAIAMCVFENRDQDVRVAFAGKGDKRVVTGSEIRFGKKGKVWVALLEARGVWHTMDLGAKDAEKVVPLDWKMPFPAQWRVDFTRPNDLVDSWEMLLQNKKGGDYLKPSWMGRGGRRIPSNRKRYTTVVGTFRYPCFSDPDGRGYLEPIEQNGIAFVGPAILYPINRLPETPVESYTVIDVIRNTLGTGPCEYILDVEGQKSEYKGRATCNVRDRLQEIYSRGQQKSRSAQIRTYLDEGLVFVRHIRGRIEQYVEFGKRMGTYLAEKSKAHPELRKPLAEWEKLIGQIDERVEQRREKIKTPAHVVKMNEGFRKNVLDYTGNDAFGRCKEYTAALVEIGDNQDELVGECRWVVKTLRQRAGLMMAVDPRLAPVATEVRDLTQKMLRNPSALEFTHH